MPKDKITLTAIEKQLLEMSGHSKQDIQDILKAIKKTTYELLGNNGLNKEISTDEAIEILGREEWVRGIARSTFYIHTTRSGLNGERVAMHSKVYI